MIIFEYALSLMLEGRLEDVKSHFPMISDEIEYLAKKDPSGNQKYLMWAAKMVSQGENKKEIAYLIDRFHSNLSKIKNKDINSYRFIEDLERAIENSETFISKRQKKQNIKKSGIRKIYENDRWFVFEPLTWEASCLYGHGTKWCISAKDQPQHWPTYKDFGTSFAFVFDKNKNENDPLHKIAITFYPNNVIQHAKEDWEDADEQGKQKILQSMSMQFGSPVTIKQLEDILFSGSEVYDSKNQRLTLKMVKNLIGQNLWSIIERTVQPDHERALPDREEIEAAIQAQGLDVPVFESLLRKMVKEIIVETFF